MAIALAKAG